MGSVDGVPRTRRIAISVFIVIVASLNLILDFDFIDLQRVFGRLIELQEALFFSRLDECGGFVETLPTEVLVPRKQRAVELFARSGLLPCLPR